MQIKPHKQSLTHSCLVASSLMILEALKNIKYTKELEQKLALAGSQRIYPFYVVGIPSEIAKKFDVSIKVFADNKYFTGILQKSFDSKNISVEHHKVSIDFIKQKLDQSPLICHIDTHGLGDYSRSSHFIVVESYKGNRFSIIDPWYGERKQISGATLEKAVKELKENVKMCPLLFCFK